MQWTLLCFNWQSIIHGLYQPSSIQLYIFFSSSSNEYQLDGCRRRAWHLKDIPPKVTCEYHDCFPRWNILFDAVSYCVKRMISLINLWIHRLIHILFSYIYERADIFSFTDFLPKYIHHKVPWDAIYQL